MAGVGKAACCTGLGSGLAGSFRLLGPKKARPVAPITDGVGEAELAGSRAVTGKSAYIADRFRRAMLPPAWHHPKAPARRDGFRLA